MKSIYIFSGLGVDERVFQNIDLSDFDVTFIRWVIPEENESIEHYAERLTAQIKTQWPVLIGLSFGGMMAIEVAKIIDTEKIILISSAQTRKELPFYFRLAGKLKLHKIVPTAILKKTNIFSHWLFGIESKEDEKLLKVILQDVDPMFLKWAIDKIVNWKNIVRHKNLRHIHGTLDRILPISFVNADLKVSNGGHFMTVNKAEELTRIMRSEILS